MNTEQFTYWLQGFLEIGNPEGLDKTQIKIIQDHLDLVFTKVTPERPKTITQVVNEMQEKNNKNPTPLESKRISFPSLEFSKWPHDEYHGESIYNRGRLICGSSNSVVYC